MPKMPHKSRNSFRVMSGVGYYWLVLRIAFRFSLHVACGRQAVMRRTSLPCNLHHSRLKLSLSRNRCKQGFGLVYKVGSCVAVTLKFLIHIHVSIGFMATIGSIYAGRKKECHCVRILQWYGLCRPDGDCSGRRRRWHKKQAECRQCRAPSPYHGGYMWP